MIDESVSSQSTLDITLSQSSSFSFVLVTSELLSSQSASLQTPKFIVEELELFGNSDEK